MFYFISNFFGKLQVLIFLILFLFTSVQFVLFQYRHNSPYTSIDFIMKSSSQNVDTAHLYSPDSFGVGVVMYRALCMWAGCSLDLSIHNCVKVTNSRDIKLGHLTYIIKCVTKPFTKEPAQCASAGTVLRAWKRVDYDGVDRALETASVRALVTVLCEL